VRFSIVVIPPLGGNVTDEVVAHYIEHQDIEPQDVDFKVTE
jgi:hypothetical protein